MQGSSSAIRSWVRRHIPYSDEKAFTVAEVTNSQNDRMLSKRSKYIPGKIKYIDRDQKRLTVMVWGGVSAESRTNLIFVSQGVKINSQTDQELILDKEISRAGQIYSEIEAGPSNRILLLHTPAD